jgi:hypothetical protein
VVSEVGVETGSNAADVVAQVRQLLLSKAAPAAKATAPFPAASVQPSAVVEVIENDVVAIAPASHTRATPRSYALICLVLTMLGVGAVWKGNQLYGPEMYGDGMVPAAMAASQGFNFAVFDLNLNIRRLRDETVQRLQATPDVVLLGASHWQEAHAGLVKGLKMYNAHVHRDFWEDPLGVVEIFAKYDRLPKRMIIAIRDNQFMPVAKRPDYLWEPGIPYYRDFADRVGLEKESYWATLPYNRVRALFSLSMLFDNFSRWYNASERPHMTRERDFEALDVLLPDGSIVWSRKHRDIFTHERAKREALTFAALKREHPPVIDPKGIEAFNALLTYLKSQGVKVYLVHPPFNPTYWQAVQGSAYMTTLREVEAQTQKFAADHGLKVFGSFDPSKVGCVAQDYIDAEHANPKCLKNVFDQFNELVRAEEAAS